MTGSGQVSRFPQRKRWTSASSFGAISERGGLKGSSHIGGPPALTYSNQSIRLVTMRTISASEFKAKCLALLDQVAESGEVVTILKRGKPVAQLVPPLPRHKGYPQDELVGTVQIVGDIEGPVLEPGAWEVESGEGG